MPALPVDLTAANGTELVPWRHCDVHTRSTFTILSLCLSTLVICVWNAVHLDVPSPATPRWKVYLGSLHGFLLGLFLPEVLVLDAIDQFMDARKLLKAMHDAQGGAESADTQDGPAQASARSLFTVSYWTKEWRPNVLRQPKQFEWTMAHAFLVVMRGVAVTSSGRTTWLTMNELMNIRQSDSSMRPFFAADGIEDHSKAGPLAKALCCWQLLVFAVSCAARRAEHLPLSLLEITTLAHSLCGLAAFALWWNKPHSVNDVIVVHIDDSLGRKVTWAQLASDTPRVFGTDIIENDNLAKAVLSSLAVAALYGLPHLLALSVEFPTVAERRCWQIATAIIIGTPLMYAAFHKAYKARTRRFGAAIRISTYGLVVAYCLASCFIVTESFRQLFALPSGAFVAPALVCYLPHFS